VAGRSVTEHSLLETAETIGKFNAILEMTRITSSLTEVQELWRAFQPGTAKSH
jgi:hypothetical protein